MPKSFDHWRWKFIPHGADFIPRGWDEGPNKRSKTGIVSDPPRNPVVNIGPYHEYSFEWPRDHNGNMIPRDEWPQDYVIMFGEVKDYGKPSYWNGLGINGPVPNDASGVYRDPRQEINPTFTISDVNPTTLVFTPIGNSHATLGESEDNAITVPVTQGTPATFSYSTPANNSRYTHAWTNVTLNPPSAGLGTIAPTSVSGNNYGITVSATAPTGTMRVISQYTLTDLVTGITQNRLFTVDYVITPNAPSSNIGEQRTFTISDPKPIFGQNQIGEKIYNDPSGSEPSTLNGPNTGWTSGLGQEFFYVNPGFTFRGPGITFETFRVPFYLGSDSNGYNKIRFEYEPVARTLTYEMQMQYPGGGFAPWVSVPPSATFTEWDFTGNLGTTNGYRLLSCRIRSVPDGGDERIKVGVFDTQARQGETIRAGRWQPGNPLEGNARYTDDNSPHPADTEGQLFFPNGSRETEITLPTSAQTPGRFTGLKIATNGGLQFWRWTTSEWRDVAGSSVGAGDDNDIWWIPAEYRSNNKIRVRRMPGKQGGVRFITWGYFAAL